MRYAVIPLALLAHSCNLPFSPEIGKSVICPVQSLACFDSQADIAIGNNPHSSYVTSQDLPTPGYANRWRYVIETPHPILVPQTHYGVNVCGEAVIWPNGLGGMYMQAETHWRIDMYPTDPAIAARFADIAGSHECRVQNFIVSEYSEGIEIMIEEPL